MIEVFDAKRTRSYGCFASFKAATDTLDSLAATGQLGSVPAVSVAAYCSGVLQREYKAGVCRWEMVRAEIPEKADAGNETCPWKAPAEMVQGVHHGGDGVPRRVSRPSEPQLSALSGQLETVQPEM